MRRDPNKQIHDEKKFCIEIVDRWQEDLSAGMCTDL